MSHILFPTRDQIVAFHLALTRPDSRLCLDAILGIRYLSRMANEHILEGTTTILGYWGHRCRLDESVMVLIGRGGRGGSWGGCSVSLQHCKCCTMASVRRGSESSRLDWSQVPSRQGNRPPIQIQTNRVLPALLSAEEWWGPFLDHI